MPAQKGTERRAQRDHHHRTNNLKHKTWVNLDNNSFIVDICRSKNFNTFYLVIISSNKLYDEVEVRLFSFLYPQASGPTCAPLDLMRQLSDLTIFSCKKTQGYIILVRWSPWLEPIFLELYSLLVFITH